MSDTYHAQCDKNRKYFKWLHMLHYVKYSTFLRGATKMFLLLWYQLINVTIDDKLNLTSNPDESNALHFKLNNKQMRTRSKTNRKIIIGDIRYKML